MRCNPPNFISSCFGRRETSSLTASDSNAGPASRLPSGTNIPPARTESVQSRISVRSAERRRSQELQAVLPTPSSNAIVGAAATENTLPNAIPLEGLRAVPPSENTFVETKMASAKEERHPEGISATKIPASVTADHGAQGKKPSIAATDIGASCVGTESSNATTTSPAFFSIKKTHSVQGVKHTLSDARKRTIHDPEYDIELGEMMDIPTELSHLANSELKYILTSLVQPTDPISRRSTGGEGKLVFQNFLSEDVLLCEHNFRDPKLAAFHMDDIVQLQIEQAGVSGKFKHIIRKHISSEITNEMLHRCNVNEEKEMSPSELTEFLKQTPNGKSSMRIASRNQLMICKGIIVKEDCGDDKPLYSVFLQTELKDK